MRHTLTYTVLGVFVLGLCSVARADYKRGYVDARFGQVHYHRAWPGDARSGKTPIVFFHQNPKSAVEYEFLLKEMGRDREALAFDTPGYGESDRPAEPPLMPDLAGAMADALDGLGYGASGNGPVDVFGFHTGAYIAAELSLIRPDLVRRVVLSGVAYRSPEERKKTLSDALSRATLPEDGTSIMTRWYLIVINRAEGVSLERAARMFVEDIHSLDKFYFAYNAVWNYALEDRFPKLKAPVAIIQPHELLLEETRRVAEELLPRAHYVEIPGVVDDVLDTGWEEYARELRRWLDAPVESGGS